MARKYKQRAPRAKRVRLQCAGCGQDMVLTEGQISSRRAGLKGFYCSRACFQKHGAATKGPAWTEEQNQYLRDNYRTMLHKEMADALGRSEKSVSAQCSKLGLLVSQPWTEEELEFVRANAGKKTYQEIAGILGRDFHAVQRAALYHGIRVRNLTPLTEAHRSEMRQWYDRGYEDWEIAAKTGIATHRVSRWRRSQHLKNNRKKRARIRRAEKGPYKRAIPPGMCMRCKKVPRLEECVHCEKCRQLNRERSREWYRADPEKARRLARESRQKKIVMKAANQASALMDELANRLKEVQVGNGNGCCPERL